MKRGKIVKRSALVDLHFCDDLTSPEKFRIPEYWILRTRVEMCIFYKSRKFSLKALLYVPNNTGNFERNYRGRYTPTGYGHILL